MTGCAGWKLSGNNLVDASGAPLSLEFLVDAAAFIRILSPWVDNLKAIFRDTNSSSEAVINGAALEKVDEIGGNGSVLVSVRVTVTDIDGVNKPSQPYRLRVIVHEDDNGHMTGYDLKYPEGGN